MELFTLYFNLLPSAFSKYTFFVQNLPAKRQRKQLHETVLMFGISKEKPKNNLNFSLVNFLHSTRNEIKWK